MVDGIDVITNWQEIKCEVCGKPANDEPYANKLVCLKHWDSFKEKQ